MDKKEKLKTKLEQLKKQRDDDIKAGRCVYEARESTLKSNKKYHWPLFWGLKIQRIFSGYKLHVLNELPKTYINAQKKELNTFDRPIIFAPNHVRKKDIEMLLEAIKKHVILLSGDFENLHGTFSGSLLEKNGIIYLDMDDPKDRKNVKEVEKQVLNTGNNIIKFYEASWDLSSNKLLYDGYFSLVQTAVDTNALIIPVAYEQPVNLNMKDNNVYIKFGEPIDFCEYFSNKKDDKTLSFEEKRLGLNIIMDRIGDLLLDILNEYSKVKRDEIPVDYWENYKKYVLSEWYFTEEDVNRKHFIDKNIIEQKDVFEHLNNLDVNKNNAFLLNKRNHH